MTVQSTNRENTYTATGTDSSYEYTFKIFDKTELRVTTRDLVGVETLLVVDVGYTVTGVGEVLGGTVVLTAGNLTAGHIITIRRDPDLTQKTDLRNQGSSWPANIEKEFDRSRMIDQAQQTEIDRSMKLPDTFGASVSADLPAPQADFLLGWNSAATALENVTIVDGTSSAQFSDTTNVLNGDAKIGVKRTITNAKATTVHEVIERSIISVFDVMTQADVNDVQAGTLGVDVQADIANAIASGNDVYMPEGSYSVGSKVALDNADQQLLGAGNLTVIVPNAATFNVFEPEADNITIRNMKINGAASDDTTTQYGIFTAAANPAKYLKIYNVTFSGATASDGLNNGIKFDTGSDYGEVAHCDFERLWGEISGTGYGVLAGTVTRLNVHDNNGIGAAGRGRHFIYLSAGCEDCDVSHNYAIAFNEDAFTMASTGGQSPNKRCKFVHNWAIDCCVNGTTASGAVSIFGHAEDVEIVDNIIRGSKAKGITVDVNGETDIDGVTISGNKVRNSDLVGIDMISATNVLVEGNRVHESSQASVGVSANIRIASDGTTTPDGYLIAANHSTGPTNARSPFKIDSTSPTVTNIKLDGNFFPTCNFAGIELNGVKCQIDGWLHHSETYNPASIANGASLTYGGITITGAAVNDRVIATHDQNHDGVSISGYVTAADTVSVNFLNNSGGAKDISNGTLSVSVQKREF